MHNYIQHRGRKSEFSASVKMLTRTVHELTSYYFFLCCLAEEEDDDDVTVVYHRSATLYDLDIGRYCRRV